MFTKSEGHNPNYLCKVVDIGKLEPHPDPETTRLKLATVDFQNVVVGAETKDSSINVYFPVESQLNAEFLSFTNSYRDKELNMDKTKSGFFEKNGRVRAVRLRGVASMGYLVPLDDVLEFVRSKGKKVGGVISDLDIYFDTIEDILLVQKYVIKKREGRPPKEGKNPRISRLVEGQVKLHVDTEQLRKNMFLIKPEDTISISEKTHGTSFWVSNVLVKRKLNKIEKLLKFFGIKIQDTENDYVYGSRKVVKNEYETQDKEHFYGYDLWEDIKNQFVGKIPAGYTIYGEALGYTKNGSLIQAGYDYGCLPGEMKLQIYRVTSTNNEGFTFDLSSNDIMEFCKRIGFDSVKYHFIGIAKELYIDISPTEHWHENFLKNLEKDYTEKDCMLCAEGTPNEGIVLRKESVFAFEAYKLKSFRFLEFETKMLDEGIEDIESQ